MAATKTNSYLEMEMLKRELFLTSEVDQNNTTTIYQAYDTKESTAETPDSSGSKKEPKKKSKLKIPLTIYLLRQILVSWYLIRMEKSLMLLINFQAYPIYQ